MIFEATLSFIALNLRTSVCCVNTLESQIVYQLFIILIVMMATDKPALTCGQLDSQKKNREI